MENAVVRNDYIETIASFLPSGVINLCHHKKDVNEMCNYGDYLYSKGEMEAYFYMVKKGLITTSDAAAELSMSEEEFINAMKDAHEGVPALA